MLNNMKCTVDKLMIEDCKLGLQLYVNFEIAPVLMKLQIQVFFRNGVTGVKSVSTESRLDLKESKNFKANDVAKILNSFPDAKTFDLVFHFDKQFWNSPSFETILAENYTDPFKKLSMPGRNFSIRIIVEKENKNREDVILLFIIFTYSFIFRTGSTEMISLFNFPKMIQFFLNFLSNFINAITRAARSDTTKACCHSLIGLVREICFFG